MALEALDFLELDFVSDDLLDLLVVLVSDPLELKLVFLLVGKLLERGHFLVLQVDQIL